MKTTNIRRLYTAIRSLSVLVSFQIMIAFLSPAMFVLSAESSLPSKVASLATSSMALAVCWFISALAILPFVIMQTFFPACRYRRVIMRVANFGFIFGGLVWAFMAFLSRNLDYSLIVWNFSIYALIPFSMAAMMANSLNNDQKEKEQKEKASLEVAHEA